MEADPPQNYATTRTSQRFPKIGLRRGSLIDLQVKRLDVALRSVPGWLFCTMIIILIYVSLWNVVKCDSYLLIANGYTDPDLQKATPNFILYILTGLSLLGICVSQVALLLIRTFVHPEISLTRNQYLGFSLYAFVTVNAVSFFVTCTTNDGMFHNIAVVMVICSLFALVSYAVQLNSRRYDNDGAQISARSKQIGSALRKLGGCLSLGFMITTMLADHGLGLVPFFVMKLAAEDGVFSSSNLQSGGEIIYISFFFLVWRPIWLKQCAKACCKVAMCYNKDLTDYQGKLNEMKFVINFASDLLFLVFGRGLLLNMSGSIGFIVVLLTALKKNVVHIWNFGCRYMDECIIFTLKMYHPAERKRLGHKFKWIAGTIDDFLRLHNLPSRLSVMWNVAVDYRELVPESSLDHALVDEEPATICVAIQMIDIKMTISNLPHRFDVAPMDVDEVATPSQVGKKPTSKWLFATKTYPTLVPSVSNMEEMDPPDIAQQGYPAFPHFPVTVGEKILLRSLCAVVQAALFQRYQTMALAKLFTNIIFLGAPCVALVSETRHLPAFQRSLDIDTPYGWKYLAVGIFFMVSDILEWLIITFGFCYRYEGFYMQIDHYLILVTKNKWLKWMISSCCFFLGSFYLHMGWDAYATIKVGFPSVEHYRMLDMCKAPYCYL